MDVKEKARQFAINAHRGQIRKNEPDKPMIIHPISVGIMLEEYGCDDNVIAAGYLHDVVEDTKFSIEDIRSEFGEDIADLVYAASEPDKSLSWEERKKHTIEATKDLPLRKKLVICADKINNLEDIMLKFQKEGKRDFSAFKRGEEQQCWYYTSIYESLVSGCDENHPLFNRLKGDIETTFLNGRETPHQEILSLYAGRTEIERLRALCKLQTPIIIEVAGSPRVSKTDTMEALHVFFRNSQLKTSVIDATTSSKYFDENISSKMREYSQIDMIMARIDDVYQQVLEALDNKSEIILIDRTICDREMWSHILYVQGLISEEEYIRSRNLLSNIERRLYGCVMVTCTGTKEYLGKEVGTIVLESQFARAHNDFKNHDEILNQLTEELSKSDRAMALDTTDMSPIEACSQITLGVMPEMRRRYIDTFKKENNL